MNRLERKVLSWLDGNLVLLAVAALSLAGVLMRLPMMDMVSGDSRFFLLPWYEEIRQNGLSRQVGNYNFLYQMLIYLMTKLPLQPLHAYKLLSILFDYGLAVAVSLFALRLTNNRWKAVLAYGAVLLSPLVALNSSAWAQCDAMYACFALWALLALHGEKFDLSLILLGLSFALKLQAVFLLPVFLFYYYRCRKFSVLRFAWIPAVMCLTAVPMLFAGRSLWETVSIYTGQTETYPYMAMNYPSAWLLVAQSGSQEQYALLKVPAMVFTVAILGGLMLYWLRTKESPKGTGLVFMAFLLSFTCVLFLPAMHERYGYVYEILAILVAILLPKTAPLCLGLMAVSLCTYGSYLFKTEAFPLPVLTVVNLILYGLYLWHLDRALPPRAEAPQS